MKRSDLEKLGLSAEQIDSIMGMHGADIEAHKSKVTDLQAQFDSANAQLTEANSTIEGFKKLDVNAIQAAADDYKAKWEQAQTEAANQLAKVKFEHALEGALKDAKAKKPATVLPLLSMDALKLKEDGTIDGLTDQLEKIKSENDYLFDGDKKDPKLVTKTNSQSVIGDPVEIAMRKAAGLPIKE